MPFMQDYTDTTQAMCRYVFRAMSNTMQVTKKAHIISGGLHPAQGAVRRKHGHQNTYTNEDVKNVPVTDYSHFMCPKTGKHGKRHSSSSSSSPSMPGSISVTPDSSDPKGTQNAMTLHAFRTSAAHSSNGFAGKCTCIYNRKDSCICAGQNFTRTSELDNAFCTIAPSASRSSEHFFCPVSETCDGSPFHNEQCRHVSRSASHVVQTGKLHAQPL